MGALHNLFLLILFSILTNKICVLVLAFQTLIETMNAINSIVDGVTLYAHTIRRGSQRLNISDSFTFSLVSRCLRIAIAVYLFTYVHRADNKMVILLFICRNIADHDSIYISFLYFHCRFVFSSLHLNRLRSAYFMSFIVLALRRIDFVWILNAFIIWIYWINIS